MADFRPFSDEKLDQWIASGSHPLSEAIAEREHRQTKKALQQSAQSHQELIAEQQKLRSAVDSLTTGQSAMKRIIDKIHCIDVWILIAGAIAALSGVILLVRDFLK